MSPLVPFSGRHFPLEAPNFARQVGALAQLPSWIFSPWTFSLVYLPAHPASMIRGNPDNCKRSPLSLTKYKAV